MESIWMNKALVLTLMMTRCLAEYQAQGNYHVEIDLP